MKPINENLNKDPILKTLVLVNQYSKEKNNNLVYLNNLIHDLYIQTDIIDSYFQQNKIQLKKLPKIEESEKSKTFFKKESIEQLERTLINLEQNKKDTLPCKRRLIIALIKDSNEYQGNLIERLNELENQISLNDLTPLVCQELMNFYSTIVIDTEKAVHYFKQLLVTNNSNEFLVDRQSVLNFISMLYVQKKHINDINKLFSELKIFNHDQINDKFQQNLIEFIYLIYKDINPSDLKDITESFYATNFSNRNLSTTKLVIAKFMDSKDFIKAYEYFKWNLETNKICVFEIFIMKYFASILTSKKKEEEVEIQFGQFLSLLSTVFDWKHIYNLLFIAHILNGNYEQASLTFDEDLNKKLDLDVLEGIVKQTNEHSTLLNRRFKFITNIYNFKPLVSDNTLRDQIKKILNK